MNKYIFFAAAAALLCTASCSDEQTFSTEGEGRVSISPKVSTDMAVVSRALQDDYAASTIIWISDSRGLIRRYNSLSELPTEPIVLRAGNYTAEGWCGDSVPASFTDRWFKACVPFTVSDGAVTNVDLTLKIANVGVSVLYDANVAEVLKDCKMTVGHTGGSLVFEGETAASRGYFMLPMSNRDLNYKLEAKQLGGSPVEISGVIADTKPATEYVLHVVYNPTSETMGAGYFTITIDEKEIPVQREDIELLTPPVFKGYGFQLNQPINCEEGKVGRRTVYISSASKVEAVEIASADFTPIIGGADVEIIGCQSSVRQALEAAGINYHDGFYNEAADNTLMQINFEESFTNTLLNGEHTFTFKATDREGRVGTATMTISISDAAVKTEPVEADDMGIYTNRATLRGTILKADAAEYGIKYRASGQAWTKVPANLSRAVGDTYTVTITGLEAGTTYEYCAYADEFEGNVYTFATEAAQQLPNAGFEEWHMHTDGKTQLIYGESAQMFWDSGNWGATTLGQSITTPDATIKHSGTYSAKLYSKFIGMGIIGKFAAGNLFAGKYLKTDGTDGILGWGRPFASRPTAVKVWAKYAPGTVDSKGKGDYLAQGAQDQGIIYMALTDGTMQTDAKVPGESWSQIVKTKKDSRQLFDKNDAKVIAYGEHVFETATAGEGLIEITIPLDYKRTDARPANIIFVCSASRYGDYFNGGEGSTMWIDDIELIYE